MAISKTKNKSISYQLINYNLVNYTRITGNHWQYYCDIPFGDVIVDKRIY